jgi:hypothetical protein
MVKDHTLQQRSIHLIYQIEFKHIFVDFLSKLVSKLHLI